MPPERKVCEEPCSTRYFLRSCPLLYVQTWRIRVDRPHVWTGAGLRTALHIPEDRIGVTIKSTWDDTS